MMVSKDIKKEVNKEVMVLTGLITKEETQTIIHRIMVGLVMLSLEVLHNLSVKYVKQRGHNTKLLS